MERVTDHCIKNGHLLYEEAPCQSITRSVFMCSSQLSPSCRLLLRLPNLLVSKSPEITDIRFMSTSRWPMRKILPAEKPFAWPLSTLRCIVNRLQWSSIQPCCVTWHTV